MTLRVRLSLWYGTLCVVALAVVSLVGYSVSVYQQYLTLDRVLIVSARLVKSGVEASGRSYALQADTLGPTRDGIIVLLRVYSSTGELVERSPMDLDLPSTSPRAPLVSPAPPAYLKVLPLSFKRPPTPSQADSAFGTLSIDNHRWRRHVVTVRKTGRITGYVEALTPLARLDQAALDLAHILFNLTLFSVVAVMVVGWLLAGSALRPIDRVTRAARAIALSRDLRQRVQTPDRQDEVGRLASTFNEMLSSLDTAWQSQERFVADASHELRAPLTVMRGNLELLRRHPQLSAAERTEMLADVEREATRMTRLVEDMLLLARSEAGGTLSSRLVDLCTVTSEAVRDARLLARGHRLRLDAPPGTMMVLGDADRLKQLLLVLLDNAIKYSPPGSPVVVALLKHAGAVTLSVTDHGPGIPTDAVPHIFDRFYQADLARPREAGGSGLGLSIAQWIVSHHAARLAVTQTGPQGTTFTVHFPPPDSALDQMGASKAV